METKSRRSREEGEALVTQFTESGLTQMAYAKSAGINVSSLQYWLRKITTADEADESGRFVELTSGAKNGNNVSLSVQIGSEVTMRFAALPPPSYLAELSREMRTC